MSSNCKHAGRRAARSWPRARGSYAAGRTCRELNHVAWGKLCSSTRLQTGRKLSPLVWQQASAVACRRSHVEAAGQWWGSISFEVWRCGMQSRARKTEDASGLPSHRIEHAACAGSAALHVQWHGTQSMKQHACTGGSLELSCCSTLAGGPRAADRSMREACCFLLQLTRY